MLVKHKYDKLNEDFFNDTKEEDITSTSQEQTAEYEHLFKVTMFNMAMENNIKKKDIISLYNYIDNISGIDSFSLTFVFYNLVSKKSDYDVEKRENRIQLTEENLYERA